MSDQQQPAEKGYKAFNTGLVCEPSQRNRREYAEHSIVEFPGKPRLCQNGAHYCVNPLDTLRYYPLVGSDGNITEFAEVEAIGDIVHDDDKSVTNKIKIGARLGLAGFIKASFDFLWEKCWVDPSTVNIDEGDSNGNHAQLASSGYGAQLASSGDSAQLASSGDSAQLASSGDSARLALEGKHSVGAAIGRGTNRIRGKLGCWITLAEWGWDDNQDPMPLYVRSAQIDGEIIKADTWYYLKGGEFVEWEA